MALFDLAPRSIWPAGRPCCSRPTRSMRWTRRCCATTRRCASRMTASWRLLPPHRGRPGVLRRALAAAADPVQVRAAAAGRRRPRRRRTQPLGPGDQGPGGRRAARNLPEGRPRPHWHWPAPPAGWSSKPTASPSTAPVTCCHADCLAAARWRARFRLAMPRSAYTSAPGDVRC